jgi:3-isopropylmalate/(R)-2-methylmalate dehydratase large subunit
MNLVEKILARASGRTKVTAGEVVVANVDRLIMHDLSGYLTAKVFDEQVKGKVRYPDRVIMVFDHHFSPPTEAAADLLQANRAWARRNGIRLFDCGNGNLHHVVVQRGLIRPGMVVVGSDSHTPVHGTVGRRGSRCRTPYGWSSSASRRRESRHATWRSGWWRRSARAGSSTPPSSSRAPT